MKNNQLLTVVRCAGGSLLILLGAVTLQAATEPSNTSGSPRTVPSDATGTGSGGMGTDRSDNYSSTDRAMTTEIARGDRNALTKLAKLGEEELALSRIAADRATNPQVRAFAADMVREHTAANAEIMALAQRKGVTLAHDGAADQQKQNNKWSDKPVGGFDEDYIDAAISNHKKTIDELEDAADSKDPEIVALATKLLPNVKAHLAHAQSLEKAVD